MTYDPTDEELAQLAALADSQQPVPASPDSNIGMGGQTPPAGAQVSDDVAAILQGMVQGQQPAPGSYQVAGADQPPPVADQTGPAAVFGHGDPNARPMPVPYIVQKGKELLTQPPPPDRKEMSPTQMYGGTKQDMSAAVAARPGYVPDPPKAPETPPAPDPEQARKDAEALAAEIAKQKAADAAAAAAKTDPNLAPGDQPPAAPTAAQTGLGAGDQPPGGPVQQEPQKVVPTAAPAAAPAATGATGPTGAATPPAATTPGAPGAAAPSPDLAKPVTDVHAWLESRKGVESHGDPNAKNPRSSASGLFQITDGTYQATLARHPELKGQDKNSEAVATAVFSDMKTELQSRLGHEPTAGEMNASWLLGPAGAAKALQADPNAPITNVVSGSQLAANPQWLNRDGSPKSVGQVLNEYNTGHTGGGGGGTGSGTAVAGATQPGYADLFAQNQARIDAYQQGQGKLMDQLKAMYEDYKTQTKPSVWDQLGDSFNSWAQAHNAAVANQLATTGGVVHHQLPNPAPFNQALQASQQNVMANRQLAADRAKTALSFGGDMVKMKMETDYKALGLSNDTVKNLVDSQFKQGDQDINRQRAANEAEKMKLELAQFGQSNTEKLDTYLQNQVGDVGIRNNIWKELLAGGIDTTKSLQENIPRITEIVSRHVAAGENITGKQNLMDISYIDPTTRTTKHEQVDTATKAGRDHVDDLKKIGGNSFRQVPLQQGTQINTPITNVMPGAGKEGGGGGGEKMSQGDQKEAAQSLQKAAEAAKVLLPYIRAHGDANMFTGNDAVKIANVIHAAVGYDPIGVAPRTLYNKLMEQIQSGLVIPSMSQLGGKPTGGEFGIIRQGQLGSEAHTLAAEAFLNHVLKATDLTVRRSDFLINKRKEAKDANDTSYDEEYELNKWRDLPGNQAPVWDSQWLLDRAREENEGRKAASAGQGGPDKRAAAMGATKPAEQPAPAKLPEDGSVTPQALAKGVAAGWHYVPSIGAYRSPDKTKYIDRMGVEVGADGKPLGTK